MRSRNTRMLTLRLDLVEDADIIAWLDSLPEGGRSQAVRNILRGGARQDTPQTGSELNLESIRSVVAEELYKVLAGHQRAHYEEMKQIPNDVEAEQRYGDKLDRMLDGFQKQTRENDLVDNR